MDKSNESNPVTLLGRAMENVPPDLVPLYLSPVKAGWPSPAEDYIDTQINLHEQYVKNPPATFFLRASGDSMIGAGIHDGDMLVVDRSVEPQPNRVVIAAVDGEMTVKRLVERKGKLVLAPENKNYQSIDITGREGVHIWGVMTSVIHKL